MKEQDHTDRLGPPAVDDLSEIAWARVERNVFSRTEGTITNAVVSREIKGERRSKLLWYAVPAFAAAACAMIFVAAHGSHGTTTAAGAAADEEPSRVVAGAAPSTVSFGDAHITLDAYSAIVMEREAERPIALLESGAAWFAVAPRGDRPPFTVLAGDAIVRVIGTRFRVARTGEHAAVMVDHGLVEIRFRGSEVHVGANQQWSSDKPGEVVAATPAELQAGGTDAADETAIDVDPVRATPKHVSHRTPRPAVAATAPTTPANDPDHARYEALSKLESKQPDAAMKGYLALSQTNGPWAEVALFAAARLAVDRHDPRAQTLLTIYLRRFPNGANLNDALRLQSQPEGERP